MFIPTLVIGNKKGPKERRQAPVAQPLISKMQLLCKVRPIAAEVIEGIVDRLLAKEGFHKP